MIDAHGEIIPMDHDCRLSPDCELARQIERCLGVDQCPMSNPVEQPANTAGYDFAPLKNQLSSLAESCDRIEANGIAAELRGIIRALPDKPDSVEVDE